MKKALIMGAVDALNAQAMARHSTAMSDDRSLPMPYQVKSSPATRREVLAAGAAAAFAVSATAADFQPGRRLYRLITAAGPHGEAFASEARKLGAPLPTMAARIGELWAQDLYFKWKLSAAPIAGLTPHHDWFLLDQMAAGAGLRTIYIAHHRESGEGRVAHEMFGPREHLVARGALDASGAAWPRAVARLILTVPTMAPMRRERSTILEASSRSIGAAELVSFVIAPPQRT